MVTGKSLINAYILNKININMIIVPIILLIISFGWAAILHKIIIKYSKSYFLLNFPLYKFSSINYNSLVCIKDIKIARKTVVTSKIELRIII